MLNFHWTRVERNVIKKSWVWQSHLRHKTGAGRPQPGSPTQPAARFHVAHSLRCLTRVQCANELRFQLSGLWFSSLGPHYCHSSVNCLWPLVHRTSKGRWLPQMPHGQQCRKYPRFPFLRTDAIDSWRRRRPQGWLFTVNGTQYSFCEHLRLSACC